MKEIRHYICEICGTEYKDKESCKSCEKGHIKPLKIVKEKYISIKNNAGGYPISLDIEMTDGRIVTV